MSTFTIYTEVFKRRIGVQVTKEVFHAFMNRLEGEFIVHYRYSPGFGLNQGNYFVLESENDLDNMMLIGSIVYDYLMGENENDKYFPD